jgi:hypothetical protein
MKSLLVVLAAAVFGAGCASMAAGLYGVQREHDKFTGKKTVSMAFIFAPDSCQDVLVSNLFRDRIEGSLMKTTGEPTRLAVHVISFTSWLFVRPQIRFKADGEVITLRSAGGTSKSAGTEGTGVNASVYTRETFVVSISDAQLKKISAANEVLVQIDENASTVACISEKVKNNIRRFASEELGIQGLTYKK